ncbi:MAG: sulfate adenylyltransferase [Betaproteobacteria bacterium]|nr:MAG: sulfate adenylyltransferase [Betaproteobacteria bacterium]
MSAIERYDLLEHGVLRFLTAGSVDDGKSTLIGRLLYDTKTILADQLAAIERTSQKRGTALDLSLLTDGLVAEREQGITIDVAYRYFATALRKFIIADAPGHEQYTRNMVTAASTAQLAVLLVDARHGVVTQTRRHATLAHLLGIQHLIVAVNKMDLVDYDQSVFAGIVADFLAFAERSGMENMRFVPMSALTGEMVVERGGKLDWYEGPTLLQILETVDVEQKLAEAPFRFPIQYVVRPTATLPRGYMGRIESGSIAVGDAVTVLPSGVSSRVREIRGYDGTRKRAGLHAAVTLVLADAIDISRGDMLVHRNKSPVIRRDLDATLCWLSETPLDSRRNYFLRHTTREVRARIGGIDHLWDVATQERQPAPDTLRMNDIGRVGLMLAQPVFADRYADNRVTGSFVLVDEATNNTVAAGLIQ